MKMVDQRLADGTASLVAVDRSMLSAFSHGKVGVEHELIALFRRLNNEDVTMLHKAVTDGDMAGVAHASHRIYGASGMIGARGLAAVSERLEAAGRASDVNAVSVNMAALRHEVERVYAFFDSECVE